MINTHLYLTQTYLSTDNLQKLISYNYFVNGKLDLSKEAVISEDELSLAFHKAQSNHQVIIFDPAKTETDSQKETFRKFLTSDVYIKYSKPTILFLGDLTSYSDTLQEGMLKLLEEPPDKLIIILFAQSLSILKPTVISRCQIHNLGINTILANLNPSLLEKVKKLPEPKSVVQHLLNNSKVEVDKVSDYERDELDFWLWQIQTNLCFLYSANPKDIIAQSIDKVINARKLNTQNLQKKFIIGWL
jgi:hypothetical protein